MSFNSIFSLPQSKLVSFANQADADEQLKQLATCWFLPLKVSGLRTAPRQVCGLLVDLGSVDAARELKYEMDLLMAVNTRHYSRSVANHQYLRRLEVVKERDMVRMVRQERENDGARANAAKPYVPVRGSLRHYLPKDHPLYRPEYVEPERATTEAGEFVLPGHEDRAHNEITDEELDGTEYV